MVVELYAMNACVLLSELNLYIQTDTRISKQVYEYHSFNDVYGYVFVKPHSNGTFEEE